MLIVGTPGGAFELADFISKISFIVQMHQRAWRGLSPRERMLLLQVPSATINNDTTTLQVHVHFNMNVLCIYVKREFQSV